MKLRLLLLAALLHTGANAQNSYRSYWKDATHYREHELDITHLKLEVSFVPEQGLVKGHVDHHFRVLRPEVDSVFFDAPAIRIAQAALNGKPLRFRSTKDGVWVRLPHPLKWDETGTISFDYEANPQRGIYFIGWNAPENREHNAFAVRKQIWTQGQGIDNRHWIPMYDDMNDKFITETIVHFPGDYKVLSNGNLVDKHTEGNETVWHYIMSHPHAGYLLMLGIGNYAIDQRKSNSGVPLNLYYYPEFPERREPTYRYSAQLIDFLEQETGIPYPWDSYSQIMVQEFLYGAMENTTATIFGDFFNVDERAYEDRNYVGVNCHELTHQWFGDYITARDGRDSWLQESFATYYPKLFTKKQFGADEYDWQRIGDYNTTLEAGKKDRFPIRYSAAGTARVYQKGSSVISMLAYVLGEDAWKRALKAYAQKHAYANVESNDIVQSIQDELGQDMSWFFDQWVYRGGEPEYTIAYEAQQNASEGSYTAITVKQTHTRDEVTGLFSMPIVFEVYYTDGTKDRVKEWIREEVNLVKIPNRYGKKVSFVLFDPNARILKSVVFPRGFAALRSQLLHAPHMLDRYDALLAMRTIDIARKREVLLEVLRSNEFYRVKAEAITQLGRDKEAQAAVEQTFLKESNPPLRLAAIKACDAATVSWKDILTGALKDASYDVEQTALEQLCRNYPDEADRYLRATEHDFGMNNSVHIKWNELAVLYVPARKDSALQRLVYLASDAWEFRTRNNAFTALKSLGYCNETLISHLFEAVLSHNSRLSGPAAQTLESLSQQAVYRNMMQRTYHDSRLSKSDKAKLREQLKFLSL
ncbi:M1 family metallopeptidase [Rurimicrobium arvi]|uniref:Membrane alanyl aminopeptidase n=1 Tax=Rurimicrobium arvi TaxID=2049916 RepID=A0ABP8MZ95_9BACT